VGKALNPSLEKEIREREGVYDKIVSHCGGEELAGECGTAGRNAVTFCFIGFRMRNAISLAEAKDKVNLILETMDSSFEGAGSVNSLSLSLRKGKF